MSLNAEPVGWKFLDSMSKSGSAAVFADFYNAIKTVAIRLRLDVSGSDESVADNIRNEMVRAMEALNRWPRGMPAVGQTITIQGESWHVVLNMTAIPHLTTAVLDRAARSESDNAYRWQLLTSLLGDSKISFGKIRPHQIRGKTWELYLYFKIQKLKVLRRLFTMQPFQHEPVLLPPNEVFPGLAATLGAISTVDEDPASVRKFLDQCDENLIRHAGKAELSRYLKKSSVSVNEFLRAQKPSFF